MTHLDSGCSNQLQRHTPVIDSDVVAGLQAGDPRALATAFSMYRERLRRLVCFRLDRRLQGRVDADDVLQESYLEASKRVEHYLQDPTASLFIWIRMIVMQTLIDLHRRHLVAQLRDAKREVSIQRLHSAQATSVALAAQLLGQLTSPSHAAMRREAAWQLESTLARMDPIDQEVLALRHFEELSNSEVAEVLGIQQKAASIRYVRAIKRLKHLMTDIQSRSFADSSERSE